MDDYDDIHSFSEFSIAPSSYTMAEGYNSNNTHNPAGHIYREDQLPTNATDHPTSRHNRLVTRSDLAARRSISGLRLTLPASDDMEQTRRAIVPLPSTYQDAVSLALSVFSEYSNGLSRENIRLRYRDCTCEGIWTWADIHPPSWSLLIQADDEVGVFTNQTLFPEVTEWEFLNGRVSVTYGKRQKPYSTIDWSPVSNIDVIDRPRTFEEAKRAIATWVSSPSVYIGIPRPRGSKSNEKGEKGVIGTPTQEEELLEKKFRFFYFTSMKGGNYTTDRWMEFPSPAAYQDDNVWRSVVPGPGRILGFMLE